jgi:hypothetical protein
LAAITVALTDRPTHASPQCLSTCRSFALVLAGLINGVDRAQVHSPDSPLLARLRHVIEQAFRCILFN